MYSKNVMTLKELWNQLLHSIERSHLSFFNSLSAPHSTYYFCTKPLGIKERAELRSSSTKFKVSSGLSFLAQLELKDQAELGSFPAQLISTLTLIWAIYKGTTVGSHQSSTIRTCTNWHIDIHIKIKQNKIWYLKVSVDKHD